MKSNVKYLLTGLALMSGMVAFAQQKNIDTIVFKISQQANNTISNGNKINSNPAIADTVKPSRKVDYNLTYNQYQTAYTPQSLQAIQLKGEPLDKLNHSMLSVGAGNYNTLYTEYYFNSLRSRDWDYGIHLNHLSSEYTTDNSGYSGFSYNDVNLYGEKFMGNHTLYAEANYDEHVVHDYGYNTTEDQIFDNNTTRERYDLFSGMLQYTSHYKDSSMVNNDIKLGYYNYSDVHNAEENYVNIDAHLFTYIQHQRLDVNAFMHYYGDDNNLGSKSTINMALNPYFSTVEKHWDAHIGLKVYDETLDSRVDVFPDLLARYHVANNALIIFAGLDGNEEYNSFKSLSTMNPYVQDTLNQQYTRTMYHIYGGLTGSITNNLSYTVSGSESEIKNMPLFVTDSLEFLDNRFAVVYDNVKVLNLHGEADYQYKKDLRITLGADWFQYTPTNQVAVWYHPNMKINLKGEYTIHSKYIIMAEVFVLGQQYAPQTTDGVLSAKELAGYPDLNLGVDYKYNKFFTAFLHLNNLANTAYQQWENYPTQRFNFLAGLRLTF